MGPRCVTRQARRCRRDRRTIVLFGFLVITTTFALLRTGAHVGQAADETTVEVPYDGASVPIPQHFPLVPQPVTAVVPVSAGAIDDVDVRFDGTACNTNPDSTTVGLSRWQIWDITITLTSPSGTTVDLVGPVPHDPLLGANLCQTVFDDEAGMPWSSSMSHGAPFTGSFRPFAALAALDGEAAAGDWTLTITDQNSDAPRESWLRAFSLLITSGGTTTTASYDGPPVLIPPHRLPWVSVPIPVVAGFTSLSDVDLRIDGLTCTEAEDSTAVGISHTLAKRLLIRLTSPSGTTIDLTDPWNGVFSSGNNLCLVTFTDEGPLPFTDAVEAPFAGFWRPADALSAFDGEDPNGTWTLSVADSGAGLDTGAVHSFTLLVSGPGLGGPDPTDVPSTTTSTTSTTTATPTTIATTTTATSATTATTTTVATTPPTTSGVAPTSTAGVPSSATASPTTVASDTSSPNDALPSTGGRWSAILILAVLATTAGVVALAGRIVA